MAKVMCEISRSSGGTPVTTNPCTSKVSPCTTWSGAEATIVYAVSLCPAAESQW